MNNNLKACIAQVELSSRCLVNTPPKPVCNKCNSTRIGTPDRHHTEEGYTGFCYDCCMAVNTLRLIWSI